MAAFSAGGKAIRWVLSATAILFGLLTVKSGGQVLFGADVYRDAAGSYVPFVVWFNFLAGFAYLIAGVGILLGRHWSVHLSIAILLATVLAFAAFGVHVANGGAYEGRTVAAMALRCLVWAAIWPLARREMLRVERRL